MPKNLKSIAIVALSTMGSRILGLGRDILVSATFGTSVLHSAFIFAFTLPNLFRRLLGEGALTSALIPMLVQENERGQWAQAQKLLNQVFARVGFLLIWMVIFGMLILWGVGEIPNLSKEWRLGAQLSALLLPYMLLICLAAVFAAALNMLKRFAIPALTAVWLNLAILVFLGGFGYLLADDPGQRLYWLCGGVLVGGFFQFIIPFWALLKAGWRPQMDFSGSSALSEFYKVLLPGLGGASIMQINVAVSRILAFAVASHAVAVLYIANRLVELPLGVFAIAVTTVIFPRLSELVAQGDKEGMAATWAEGLRLILAITVPAACGLAVLREPILSLLFEWGVFDAKDVSLTAPVLLVFALALPGYGLSTYVTRGFHSLKDMKTPVKVALWTFIMNLVFSLLLMWKWEAVGLALASTISTAFQTVILIMLLKKKEEAFAFHAVGKAILQICIAALVMSILCALSWWGLSTLENGKLAAALTVCGLIPVSVLVYFGVLWAMRFEDRAALVGLLKK